jgi:hypothetical protein
VIGAVLSRPAGPHRRDRLQVDRDCPWFKAAVSSANSPWLGNIKGHGRVVVWPLQARPCRPRAKARGTPTRDPSNNQQRLGMVPAKRAAWRILPGKCQAAPFPAPHTLMQATCRATERRHRGSVTMATCRAAPHPSILAIKAGPTNISPVFIDRRRKCSMVGQPNRFEQCSVLFGETDSFDDVFDQNGLNSGQCTRTDSNILGLFRPQKRCSVLFAQTGSFDDVFGQTL